MYTSNELSKAQTGARHGQYAHLFQLAMIMRRPDRDVNLCCKPQCVHSPDAHVYN